MQQYSTFVTLRKCNVQILSQQNKCKSINLPNKSPNYQQLYTNYVCVCVYIYAAHIYIYIQPMCTITTDTCI